MPESYWSGSASLVTENTKFPPLATADSRKLRRRDDDGVDASQGQNRRRDSDPVVSALNEAVLRNLPRGIRSARSQSSCAPGIGVESADVPGQRVPPRITEPSVAVAETRSDARGKIVRHQNIGLEVKARNWSPSEHKRRCRRRKSLPAEAVIVIALSAAAPTGLAVVKARIQPLVITPESNTPSSSTKRFQVPFGFAPLSTVSVEPYGGDGGER